jgi:hypothetical protein
VSYSMGFPIVYNVSHLLDYLSSCFNSTLTHVADGRCVVSEFSQHQLLLV